MSGNVISALLYLAKALKLVLKMQGGKHLDVIAMCYEVGSENTLEKALNILVKTVGEEHPLSALIRGRLEQDYRIE